MKAPPEHPKIHTVNQRPVPVSAGAELPILLCGFASFAFQRRDWVWLRTRLFLHTMLFPSSLLPRVSTPPRQSCWSQENGPEGRGFSSYEEGSKAMGVFTPAGVTRSPVILHDYFSPSCEMAGR